MNLIEQGLAVQRMGRMLTDYVDVVVQIGNAKWEGECEVVYTYAPASPERFDEPGYAAHIEIHSVMALYKGKKVDLTPLVDEEMAEAIQDQVLS